METLSSYDEMAQFFAESGLVQQADPAQSVVKLPVEKDALESVLFVRWEAETQVVHFVLTLPFEIPEERMSALAHAVCLLNHALFLPGFGINAGQRRCYHRVTIPLRPDGTITKQEIQGLFNLSVATAARHLGKLQDIATNGADPTSILQQSA